MWHVRRSLGWIHPADVVGIDFIELQDKISQATVSSPDWHKRATDEDFNVNGLYMRREGDYPASITLFTRDLYRALPKLYWLTPVTTIRVAIALAHEVGHHLIAERGYVFAPGEKLYPAEYEEEMVYRYAYSVIKRMRRRWYYRLGIWAMKDLAGWHYVQAMLNWRAGNYMQAAQSWYNSFTLDPSRDDAIYWYKRAKDAAIGHKD